MHSHDVHAFQNPLDPFHGAGVPGDDMENVLSLQTFGGAEGPQMMMAVTSGCCTDSCSGDTSSCETGTCSGNTNSCSTSTC